MVLCDVFHALLGTFSAYLTQLRHFFGTKKPSRRHFLYETPVCVFSFSSWFLFVQLSVKSEVTAGTLFAWCVCQMLGIMCIHMASCLSASREWMDLSHIPRVCQILYRCFIMVSSLFSLWSLSIKLLATLLGKSRLSALGTWIMWLCTLGFILLLLLLPILQTGSWKPLR